MSVVYDFASILFLPFPPPHSSHLFIYFSALFFLLSVGLKITICYRVRIHAFAAIFIDRVPLPRAHRFTHRLYCFGFSALTTLKRQNTKIFAFFSIDTTAKTAAKCHQHQRAEYVYIQYALPAFQHFNEPNTRKLKCFCCCCLNDGWYSSVMGNCFDRETIKSPFPVNSFIAL